MKETLSRLKQYLLSGVSHMIPLVACGGILIAMSIAFAPMGANGPDFSGSPMLKTVFDIGVVSFKMMVPVLAAYIAYGMADKPGLAAGFVGGYIANETGAGFLGAILAGLAAGACVQALKKLRIPRAIRPVMPILIVPILSSLAVGLLMYCLVGEPIRAFNVELGARLGAMQAGSATLLALILGAMIAFDMGGPVNKAAFSFSAMMITQGNYRMMGSCAAAICIPPLGLGLATLIGRRFWSESERSAGIAALTMGTMGVTEGAIPFAVADPFRVIPVIMVGSMTGSVIAMAGHVGDHAPHGGLIVAPVVDNLPVYLAAVVSGSLVVAVGINALKWWRLRGNPEAAE